MASNNTFSAILQIAREAVNRGSKNINIVASIVDVVTVQIVEQVIAGDATGVEIDFGPVTTAVGFVVFTSKKVGLHINDPLAPEIPCGSITVIMDTGITSLVVDNDLLDPEEDVTVEVWLIATS